MIKPLSTPQLSAAKPRSGLQSISELLPRLMRHYELQAELVKQRSERSNQHERSNRQERSNKIMVVQTSPAEQATFAWYE